MATRGLTPIQIRFQQVVGEPGYTFSMIADMLAVAGLRWHAEAGPTERRNRYIKRAGLHLRFADLGITFCPWDAQSMVPQSRLQEMLDGLGIPASLESLRRAAMKLDYPW